MDAWDQIVYNPDGSSRVAWDPTQSVTLPEHAAQPQPAPLPQSQEFDTRDWWRQTMGSDPPPEFQPEQVPSEAQFNLTPDQIEQIRLGQEIVNVLTRRPSEFLPWVNKHLGGNVTTGLANDFYARIEKAKHDMNAAEEGLQPDPEQVKKLQLYLNQLGLDGSLFAPPDEAPQQSPVTAAVGPDISETDPVAAWSTINKNISKLYEESSKRFKAMEKKLGDVAKFAVLANAIGNDSIQQQFSNYIAQQNDRNAAAMAHLNTVARIKALMQRIQGPIQLGHARTQALNERVTATLDDIFERAGIMADQPEIVRRALNEQLQNYVKEDFKKEWPVFHERVENAAHYADDQTYNKLADESIERVRAQAYKYLDKVKPRPITGRGPGGNGRSTVAVAQNGKTSQQQYNDSMLAAMQQVTGAGIDPFDSVQFTFGNIGS